MAAAIIKNEGQEFAVSFATIEEKKQILNSVNSSSFNGLRFLYSTIEAHVPPATPLITINQFLN